MSTIWGAYQYTGMQGITAAAAISRSAMPEQNTCISDLSHIAQQAAQQNLVSPAIIVVGDVISHRAELNFYEKRPLFGKRFLILKIGGKLPKLKELLEKQGAYVDKMQIGEIVPIEMPLTKECLCQTDWLIFTSKNGVDSFF